MKKLDPDRLEIGSSPVGTTLDIIGGKWKGQCPIGTTLDIIGGKWKGLIVFHLFDGKKRFGELQRLLPGVTQRMLTLHLRQLEEDDIIYRNIYREIPPKVEYSLTDFGNSLQPIFLLMHDWGMEYMETLKERKQRAYDSTLS